MRVIAAWEGREPPAGRRARSRHSGVGFAIFALVAVVAVLPGLPQAPAAAAECANSAFRTGPSAHLPDCRAYEQVSPAEKASEDAFGEGGLSQAAGTGDEIAYTSKNVFAQSPGAGVETAYLGMRGAEGWSTIALSPRVSLPVPGDSVSYAFSADLSQAVLKVPLQALTPEAPEGVYNLFVRDAEGGYALVTASPPSVAIPAGCDTCYLEHDVPVFTGASSDFTHVAFEANESLLTTPAYPADPDGEAENLYESNLSEPPGQRVHPVGVLPDGTLAAGGAQPGAGGGNFNAEAIEHVEHAVSADGSRIVFTAQADGGEPDAQQGGLHELYDRIGGPAGRTIEASAPAAGAGASKCKTPNHNCKAEPAQFWDASEDGSSVLFTSRAELTEQSNTGPAVTEGENAGEDLYSYNVDEEKLTDLTPDSKDPDGANVQGFVAASSDASSVYFVARSVLAGKNAEGDQPTAGKDNLYLIRDAGHEGGSTVFVATLAEPEGEALGDSADWTAIPEDSQAYATPDGLHLAFTSVAPLTGYDNEDQYTEQPDKEVFEYSATSGRLECGSCNSDPSIRPGGNAFIGREIAAQSEGRSPLYEPRALSGEGNRLFFSSSDSLTPESATHYVKVYEFEEGAIHLISGGVSESNDIFMDASEDGDDVFFATSQPLTPSDHDEASDVYDARVQGGLPAALSSAPASCEGEGCLPSQSPPPAFARPDTVLSDNGNLPTQSVAAARSSKPPAPPTRAERLAKALRACARERKPRRGACRRLAERRYGRAKTPADPHRSSTHAR